MNNLAKGILMKANSSMESQTVSEFLDGLQGKSMKVSSKKGKSMDKECGRACSTKTIKFKSPTLENGNMASPMGMVFSNGKMETSIRVIFTIV